MMKNSDRTLAQLLDECAELLIQGESVNGCLARYPEQAATLGPLLQSVAVLRQYGSVPPREVAVAARSRAQFMSAAAQLPAVRARQQPSGLTARWAQFRESLQVLRPLPAGLMAAVACILVIGLLTTGVVSASASALPGDRLYGVKLVAEQARMALTLDPVARQTLGEQMQRTRVQEAGEVLKQHREVTEMRLAGQLEDIQPGSWRVAGLTVLVNSETVIKGTPEIGATVHGTVRAPGDGTLVGVSLQVEAPPPAQPSGSSAQPVSVVAADTPAPTLTPWVVTNTPPPTAGRPEPPAANEMPAPPEDYPTSTRPVPVAMPFTPVVVWATSTPTPMPVLGTAPAPTPTVPAPAPTATTAPVEKPTNTPWPTPPRTDPKVVVDGWVEAVSSSHWTVSGTAVEVDTNTVFVDGPTAGDRVRVSAIRRSDGTLLAREIRLMARAATPEPIELTGFLIEKGADAWVIDTLAGKKSVKVSADTVVVGNPQVGDPVHCAGGSYADGIHADRIEVVPVDVYDLAGVIEEVALDHWRISGYNVYIVNGQTEIGGVPPQVGRIAQARVVKLRDGRLIAKAILVLANTPTPTPTQTPIPSSTPTPTETPLPSSTPTPSVTPQPTYTATATPTETPVPSLGTNVPPDITAIPTETPTPTATTIAANARQ